LGRTDSGATIFLLIGRAGQEFARLDIGYDNALVVTERLAAGASRSSRHPVPERRRVRVKTFHARSLSDAWSAASIWTLAASDAINSMAAPRICAYKDSGVDSEIRRVLIDWSVLAPATSRASRCSLCRSAACACLAFVMSRAILEHPIILPAGSRNGEIVNETSMRAPAW
jgi:hypothetical protein